MQKKIDFFYLRFFMLITGCILISYGISVFKFVNLGLDPYGCLIVSFSNMSSLSYGSVLLLSNIILFLLSFLIFKQSIKYVGIGTIINMSIIGYIIDFISIIYDNSIKYPLSFEIKILWSLISLPIFAFGVSLYIKSSLGIAPYELLSISIIERLNNKINFSKVRVFQDIFSLSVSYILRVTIGINTIILAFFTGNIIAYFNKICDRYIVKDRWI